MLPPRDNNAPPPAGDAHSSAPSSATSATPAKVANTTGPIGRVDPSLPRVFGRYLLIQRLSRGGMGEIFLAKHGLAGFEKLAVIKKVLPNLVADEQFISRFVDEAQVAIKLQHVNVAQVFEVGRVGDEYFLALEYVEGRDLRRTTTVLAQRKRRMPADLALFIGRELANGLAYAHRRTSPDGKSLNLVHCDISPPNVVVSFEGETKVIDFGIAKSALRGTASDPKMGFGKFGYMAPEQLIRGGVVDYRTDIYAAGVVLFELLTGQRLYEAGPEPDYRTLAKAVASGDHKLPSQIDPKLKPYDDLVATALRPKVADRYQSAAELRDAIQHALVAVNPTISTDQLGAFMRDLFADEMTAQRELHERIARTHLEDFHDQLTKETGTTVSFAFTSLLPPIPGGPVPGAPATTTTARPRPPTLPTASVPPEALAAAAAAVAATHTPKPTPPAIDHSLADGTGTLLHEAHVVPVRSRRGLYLALGGAAVVVAIVVAVVAHGGARSAGGKAASAPVAAAAPPAKPKIIVEAIPVDEPTPAGSAGSAAEAATPAAHPTTRPHDRPHGSAHGHPAATKPADATRATVSSKFQAVKREYDAYKSKNGGRLESEWGDLVTFMQFHPDSYDEAAHRIDEFRSKLKP